LDGRENQGGQKCSEREVQAVGCNLGFSGIDAAATAELTRLEHRLGGYLENVPGNFLDRFFA
jgi:hypothetical protein